MFVVCASLFLGRPYADESVQCIQFPIDCLRCCTTTRTHEGLLAAPDMRRAGDYKNRRSCIGAAVWLLSTLTSLTAANPPKCNEGFFIPLHWYYMIRVELNDILTPSRRQETHYIYLNLEKELLGKKK